jgi:hypothetical protein
MVRYGRGRRAGDEGTGRGMGGVVVQDQVKLATRWHLRGETGGGGMALKPPVQTDQRPRG